ncbi:MAG: aldehyde dehydrogenase family protein [Candidatus Krumholzibacteriota bacterium]|nr:aldehyde dehydrogenase family protein [Candidatus Krumholzibacteriota bacterium]
MKKLCYLAGVWEEEGELFEVRSPFDGEVVGTALRPGKALVERAVARAGEAFETGRKMPVFEKAGILEKAAREIAAREDELARLIVQESGKPMVYARGEARRAVLTFTEAAQECSRLYGELLPLDISPAARGRVGITSYFPVGPVLAITPFNFPLNLVAHKVAPAIAAGCPLILKPSSETPLTALYLADILDRCGLPPGMLSVLPMTGKEAGELARREEIKKVTFTGSAAVGWDLKKTAWDKKVTLELGGNAAVVLHEDWDDMEGAVERIVTGGYAYSGQVCISVQRIFVHRSLEARFREIFIPRVAGLKRGDPLEEETRLGPMINEGEARRVESWVNEAVKGGARVETGGVREGAYYASTVISGARSGMKVLEEEIFGPVTVLGEYEDFSEALRRVNDSKFGLQAGVYTRDVRRIRQAFAELEVGGVVAGDVPTFRVDRMPYGGVKRSGAGREGLRYSIREMCEPRLLVLA